MFIKFKLFILNFKSQQWTLFNGYTIMVYDFSDVLPFLNPVFACTDLSSSSNTLRVRRLQVFKQWMFFSTNTLHSYFMGLVLRSFSKHLDESIRLAESIDVIVQGILCRIFSFIFMQNLLFLTFIE